jgi:hypothetical protein
MVEVMLAIETADMLYIAVENKSRPECGQDIG